VRKIIALYAAANRGKTTTLNKLIDLLSIVSEYYESRRSNEGWTYFEIKGLKVVVCTPGDAKGEIKCNAKYATDYDCDIFVTATRTKGETTAEIAKFTKKQKAQLVWIKKENNEENNSIVAANLFNLIIKDVCENAGFNFNKFVFE